SADSPEALYSREEVLHAMPRLPDLLVVVDHPRAIRFWRDDRDAAAVLDIQSDRVAVVGLVGEHEAAIDESAYGIHGADAVMLVAADKPHAQREADHVDRGGNLGVAASLGLSKFLPVSGKRMLRGVLMRLDVRGVEHHRNREAAVATGDPLEDPIPHSGLAPSAEASPHAVVLAASAGELVPHRSGAEYPPDPVKRAIEALVRAAATAAYLFAVGVVNFFSSSRKSEGISSALYSDIEYYHTNSHRVASQHVEIGEHFVHVA